MEVGQLELRIELTDREIGTLKHVENHALEPHLTTVVG